MVPTYETTKVKATTATTIVGGGGVPGVGVAVAAVVASVQVPQLSCNRLRQGNLRGMR